MLRLACSRAWVSVVLCACEALVRQERWEPVTAAQFWFWAVAARWSGGRPLQAERVAAIRIPRPKAFKRIGVSFTRRWVWGRWGSDAADPGGRPVGAPDQKGISS